MCKILIETPAATNLIENTIPCEDNRRRGKRDSDPVTQLLPLRGKNLTSGAFSPMLRDKN